MTIKMYLQMQKLRSWDRYLQQMHSIDYKTELQKAPLRVIDRDMFGSQLAPVSFEEIIGKQEDFKDLFETYHLAQVCKGDNSFEKAINVMSWLTENTYYSGAALNTLPDDTEEILRYSFGRTFRNAINCRQKAIALTDLLCACGIKAYPVLLQSALGAHFVCHVYYDTLNKWCVLDPSFNTWFSFGTDEPLNAFELRDIFLSGGEPILHGYSFNHTCECLDIYENAFIRATLSNISTWKNCRNERRRSRRHFKKTDFAAALPIQ